MNRIRTILFEGSVIVLVGVTIALGITAVLHFMQRPSLENFKQAYGNKKLQTQVRVAEAYLNVFSPGELNGAIEEQNAAGFCHSQAHALGRAVYRRYPNLGEAIRQCGNSCTFGCFHGVLMEMFQTDSDSLGGAIEEESPEAYLKRVETVAKDLCNKPEVASSVHKRYCHHGIGHVFETLSGNDLKRGLDACDIYSDYKKELSCRSGVFMEYLFDPSNMAILNTTGPEPCSSYPMHTGKCYRYKAYGWIKANGDNVEKALAACDQPGMNRDLCVSNTAEAYATPLLLSTEYGIKEICGSLDGDLRDICIDGALTKVIDLNNGDDSAHVCDGVAAPYHERCLEVRNRFLDDIYFDD